MNSETVRRWLPAIAATVMACLLGYAAVRVAQHAPFLDGRSIKRGVGVLAALALLYFAARKQLGIGAAAFALLPVIVFTAGKGQALLSVLLVSAASTALGAFTYSRFAPNERGVGAFCYSFFLGLALNALLLWICLHFHVNFPHTYTGLFLLEILVFGKTAYGYLFFREAEGWHAGQSLLAAAAVFYVFYTLVPDYAWDDLIVHLHFPKQVALNGIMDFHPRFAPALDMAIIPRASYTAVYMMGGEFAVRLFNLLVLWAGTFLMESFVRQRFGARAAAFAVLVIMTMPILLWQIGIAFIDSFEFFSAAVLFCLAFSALKEERPGLYGLFFPATVLAYLSKQHAIFLILPTSLLVTVSLVRAWLRTRDAAFGKALAWGSLAGAGVLAAVFIHNYMISGNPMFPYFNGIFQSPWFPPTNFADALWHQPLTWRSLHDMAFHGSRYVENIDFAFGFSFFVFLPLLLLLFFHPQRRDLALTAFCFLAACAVWYKLTGPYMRYFITCLPVGAVLLAASLDQALAMAQPRRWLVYAAGSGMAAVFALNWACQMSIAHVAAPYPVREALTGDYEGNCINYHLAVKKVFDYANLRYGKNANLLLVGTNPFMYFTNSRVESLMWYHPATQKEILEETGDARAMYDRIFNQRKFTAFIMPEQAELPYSRFYAPEFQSLVRKEYTSMGFALYVPADQAGLAQ